MLLAAHNNLSIIEEMQGNWKDAVAGYQEALSMAERLGSIIDQVRLENSLGTIYTKLGDESQASAYLDHAVMLARRHQDSEDLCYCITTLAELRLRTHDLDGAEGSINEARVLVQELGIGQLSAELDYLQAQIYLEAGNLDAALHCAMDALVAAQERGLELETGKLLGTLGVVRAAAGEREKAHDAFKQSSDLLDGADVYEAARTKLAWGRFLLEVGNADEGRPLLRDAKSTFINLGAQRDERTVDSILAKWFNSDEGSSLQRSDSSDCG